MGKQIDVKITYDAAKLAKKMPIMIKEVMKRFAREVATQSKGHIDKGLMPPLTKTTKDIRKKRGTGARNKPLYNTGKLYNSIKLKETKDTAKVSMFLYGALHHKGYNTAPNSMIPRKRVPKRPFIYAKKKTSIKIFKDFGKSMSKFFKKSK